MQAYPYFIKKIIRDILTVKINDFSMKGNNAEYNKINKTLNSNNALPLIATKPNRLFDEIIVNKSDFENNVNNNINATNWERGKKLGGASTGFTLENKAGDIVYIKKDRECESDEITLKSMVVANTLYNLGAGAETDWVLDSNGDTLTISKSLHKAAKTVFMEAEDVKNRYPKEYERVKQIAYILNLSDVLNVNQFWQANRRKGDLERANPDWKKFSELSRKAKLGYNFNNNYALKKLMERAQFHPDWPYYLLYTQWVDEIKKNPKYETLRNAALIKKKNKKPRIEIFDYWVDEPDVKMSKPNKLEDDYDVTKFAKIDSNGNFVNEKGFKANPYLEKANFQTIMEYSFKQALKKYANLNNLNIPTNLIDSLKLQNPNKAMEQILSTSTLAEQDEINIWDALKHLKKSISREKDLRLSSQETNKRYSEIPKLPPIIGRPR